MKHLWAYLQERFPLPANGALIISYFGANYLLARGATWPGERLEVSWRFLVGSLALLLMFFHLRVIDEHKDFARDLPVYPLRVLSRGLITLRQLRRLGFAAVALEVMLSFFVGWAALAMCLVILAGSWLVYKEFYLGDALGRHLLLSAAVHLLLMPLYCLYVFAAATGRYPWAAPAVVWCYALVSYGVGFAYELARKTRAPQDERPGLITYSSVIGPVPSAVAMLAALVFSGLISLWVAGALKFGAWYPVTLVGLLLAVALAVVHFRWHTTTQAAARLPVYAGMALLAFDWLLAAELIRLHGLTWV